MDLVGEEVRQGPIDALAGTDAAAAIEHDLGGERRRLELVTEADQTAVALALGRAQVLERRPGRRGLVEIRRARHPLERAQIVAVDEQNVVQGEPQGWKEARALRVELLRGQPGARFEQAVIRPGVVARHGAEIADQRHGRLLARVSRGDDSWRCLARVNAAGVVASRWTAAGRACYTPMPQFPPVPHRAPIGASHPSAGGRRLRWRRQAPGRSRPRSPRRSRDGKSRSTTSRPATATSGAPATSAAIPPTTTARRWSRITSRRAASGRPASTGST